MAVLVATVLAVGIVSGAWAQLGASSVAFAVVAVWLPMTWLGTVSHLVPVRLPEALHRLRPFERDGRLYELLGVKVAKRIARRGPITLFNPNLRLPRDRTPDALAEVDNRMRTAEATHGILFVITGGMTAAMAVQGSWSSAAVAAVLNVLVNGYPLILQRYNRARLARENDGAH